MAHDKNFKDESQDARRHDQNKAEHPDKKPGREEGKQAQDKKRK